MIAAPLSPGTSVTQGLTRATNRGRGMATFIARLGGQSEQHATETVEAGKLAASEIGFVLRGTARQHRPGDGVPDKGCREHHERR